MLFVRAKEVLDLLDYNDLGSHNQKLFTWHIPIRLVAQLLHYFLSTDTNIVTSLIKFSKLETF